MKTGRWLRITVTLALLVLLIPFDHASASPLASNSLPPVDMFQLPWEQGQSWVSLDGFDNGFKRLITSPHFYLNGGAVDFAPHTNTFVGEDTSNYWVTAAAAGTVTEVTYCSLKIDHGNGFMTDYQFLARIQVKAGQAVARNQRLGVIADGSRQPFCRPSLEPDIPHLHFSLRPQMLGANFSGWVFNYNPLLNRTTFTKNGQTVGSYEPLSNEPGQQISLRDPITWDTVYIGSVDVTRFERWPFVLNEPTSFILTATPTTAGLVPLLVLLDANGNEISRAAGVLKSTQPAGNYFVQVQPQSGQGFYNLTLQKDNAPTPTPGGSSVSTIVTPASISVDQVAAATVDLGGVPAEGYKSTEFTCTYDASLVEVRDIAESGLFGPDAVVVINGPQNGSFILAVAGSNGQKATTGGAALSFNLKGLQPGQTSIQCQARVSTGDNLLTSVPSTPSSLTILSNNPTPGPTADPGSTPIVPTPTSPSGDWLTFSNATYGFQFQYPPQSQVVSGGTDNDTRINLPFAPGTNLSMKYLEMVVVPGANPCRSPLATSSILATSASVVINGNSWLKETGGDGTAGHINKWTAYSIQHDTACISLEFVLRSTNPGVFTTPPPLYDETAESAVFEQIVATYAAVTPTPEPVNGTLTGQVLAGKPVTISLYNADASLAATATANTDGTFSLTAPAGTYTAVASASGFLSAQASVTLTAGLTNTLPAVSLPAGDIDGNHVIDQFDAMTIGMSYNTALPAAADLNGDGIINVLDLEMLAANFHKSGALAWQ